MNIQIVADSSCDLPIDIIKEMNIDILSVPITDGTNIYKDSIDIQTDELYKNMKEGVVYKTSQVPINDYIEKYTYYAKNDIPILSVVMSSGLSSTHVSSQIAINTVKETYKDAKIYSVDSKCCSLGYGYAVYLLSKVAKNGSSLEDLIELLEFVQKNLVSTASLDDLKYVARGGRLPNAAAVIANSLNIKPFLHADDGSLHLFDKARGNKKMLKKYTQIVEKRIETSNIKDTIFWIEKSDDEQMMTELKETMKDVFGLEDKNFVISTIGCTVGAHVGPGAMCMFFLKNPVPSKFLI